MATRQYIGARYVPKFFDDGHGGSQWKDNIPYEALVIVTNLGNSYTSKKPVPIGVQITDTNYWVLTGSYNAQVEEYREQVEELSNKFDTENHNNNAGEYYKKLEVVGKLDLPNGHTTQGATIYNDYLYVFHNINDYSENMISKFKRSDLTLIGRLSLPDGMHGNGLTVNPNTNMLIVTNSYINGTSANEGTLIFVPISTFNSYTIYDYRNGTATSISATAISPDGIHSWSSLTGSTSLLTGYITRNVATPYGTVTEEFIGGAERQDMAMSNTFAFILHTNAGEGNKYGCNYVNVFTAMGDHYGRIYFDKDLDELEGISCNDDITMTIVDVNGKVLECDVSDVLSTRTIGGVSNGFRSFGGKFGYYVNTQVCVNPDITWYSPSDTDIKIATKIPVHERLISSYMLAYIIGTCLINNNKGFCEVTATGGLRLFSTAWANKGELGSKMFDEQVNYRYENGYWLIENIRFNDQIVNVTPDTIASDLAEWQANKYITGETSIFGFGNKFTERGYPVIGMKVTP